MKSTVFTWLKGAATALLLITLNLNAADATGTWKWTSTGQNGQTRENTLNLKQNGDKLTGAILGRDGAETAIAAGKVQDGEISFTVTRERNGTSFTSTYKGKLSGDAIKGTISFERDGNTTSRDWEAKREKPKASLTGTWKWSFTNQNDQVMASTLKLKQAGQELAGVMVGRTGTETAIEDAKITGDDFSFSITRERNGNKVTTKYSGKLDGDTIKGKIEGGTRTRDWVAQREKLINLTGTWKFSMARPDGTSNERTIKLKQDGSKLTGVSIYNDTETAIEEAKLTGSDLSFQITRERDGNKFVIKYTGKVEGDSIKGKIQANFGGEDRSFDWDAKRVKE